MHSTRELSPASFAIEVAGRPARLEDVLPGFTAADRLGVVVRRPGGAVGASLLILAAVTGFYAIHRRSGEDFFIYPDYFVFHVGGRFGDHRRLEIWPSHKEVVVEGAAEQVLEAVNDRGITRLLVEDGRPAAPDLAAETLASARSRIRTVLAYAPDGRVGRADLAVSGNAVTEGYAESVLTRSAVGVSRRDLRGAGRPVETYRTLALDEALGLLAPPAAA